MDQILEKLGSRFLGFFTRSVAPSSVFFILLFFNDMYFNNSEILKYTKDSIISLKSIDLSIVYIVIVIVFLSYGFINQCLSQLQDEFIKNDYTNCDESFIDLREEVKSKLESSEGSILEKVNFTDYNFYQVLGRKIDTGNSYVDFIKSIHTISTAISLNILIYVVLFSSLHNTVKFLSLIFFIPIVLLVFHFISKSRYKSRNKRLYINYLLEKELKIKNMKLNI